MSEKRTEAVRRLSEPAGSVKYWGSYPHMSALKNTFAGHEATILVKGDTATVGSDTRAWDGKEWAVLLGGGGD
jgi:hypothetical protein